MKQLQLLRYIIENPIWLDKIQYELLQNEWRSIFTEAQALHAKGLKPTYEALVYKNPKLEQSIDTLKQETLVDDTTFLLIKEELRQEAFDRFGESLVMLDWSDTKQRQHIMKRFEALQLDEEPQILGIGTSFDNFQHHIQIEGVQIYSGFNFLDTTGSGLEKGQLATILAPSNNGKSTLLAAMARNMIAKKLNVIYFAFEETREDFLSRIGRGLLKQTTYQYSQHTLDELQWLWMDKVQDLGELTVITGEIVAVEDLKDIIKKNEEYYGIKYDAVFIDYSSHLKLNSSNKNQRDDQKISQIFRELKQYANSKDEQRVVVTAVQANREGYKNTLTADKAADSLGGIRESDLVLGIRLNTIQTSQIIEPKDEWPERVQGVFEINVIKRRKGTLQLQSKYYYEFLASNTLNQILNENVIAQFNTRGFEDIDLPENYFELFSAATEFTPIV